MRRDPRKFLWEALRAAELVHDFAQGQSFEDYQSNAMLRSAVERQFEIIGEALNQLSKVDPEAASHIPELPRIVAFRNILIHGYATVDGRLGLAGARRQAPRPTASSYCAAESRRRVIAQSRTGELGKEISAGRSRSSSAVRCAE